MRWFWQKENDGSGNSSSDRSSADGSKHHRQAPEYVRVFDFDTKEITTIHAAELAPGMGRIKMDGVEGEVWVELSRLTQNVYQHPPFDEETRGCLRGIKTALDEVYPMSLEQWEDGFRRDRNPEREIAYWLHLAEKYSLLVTPEYGLGLTLERRQAILRILAGCGVSPKKQVLMIGDYGPLTREEAERVLAIFYGED